MERTNENLNLSVLRRHNPSIASIISLASYSVIYTFSPDSGTWEKTGIEGTMFVCSLYSPHADPEEECYSVIVLNRHGLDNFEVELTRAENVDVDSPSFVIITDDAASDDKDGTGVSRSADQAGAPIAYGVWIFAELGTSTEQSRELNARVIKDCAGRAEESRRLRASRREEGIGMRTQEQQAQQVYGKGQIQQRQGYMQHNGSQEMGLDGSSSTVGRQLNLLDLFKKQERVQQPLSSHDPTMAHRLPTDSAPDITALHARPMQSQQGPRQDVLGDLFSNAQQGYPSAV